MKKTIRIGVFGCWRGDAYVQTFIAGEFKGARITALCDKNEDRLKKSADRLPKGRYAPKLFTDAEEFVNSGLFDAVILTNYFNEHAQYAIRFLNMGIHVFSENMAAATMSLAVDLCRAAEKSKAVYMMAENYLYNKSVMELKRVYDGGQLGKAMFCEGEYFHPSAPPSSGVTRHDWNLNGRYHWRRYHPITYYSSHSLGPLMYITGEMPTRVVGMAAFDTPEHIEEYRRLKAESTGVMLVNTDKGSVFRVNGTANIGQKANWYRISCARGEGETVRGHQKKVRIAYNEWTKPDSVEKEETIYEPEWISDGETAEKTGHAGGDYWCLRYFLEAVRGEREPVPNVYQAAAMSAVAILGWRSILNGNCGYEIPDFTNEEERKKWEDDRANPWPTEDTPANIPFTTRKVAEGKEWS